MRTNRAWLSAIAVAVSCGGAQHPPRVEAQPGDVVITDVTVVPMDRDGALPHHTVVVRGDRIVAVAPNAGIRIPPGATRIDGAGKWLIPGLADMHVHTFDPDELTLFVAAGVTTIRNMWGMPLHLEWRERIARGDLVGPTIVTAGPIVDGEPPIWPGSTVLTDPAKAAELVASWKQAGYDFVKPYAGLKPDVYDALAAAAKEHGLPMGGHVPREVGLAHAIEAGQRSVEHLDGWMRALLPEGTTVEGDGYWKRMGAMLDEVDESRIPALVERTKAAGTWNCPTMTVWTRFAALNDLDELRSQVRWLDMVPPATLEQWDPKNDFRLKTMDAADYETLRRSNALNRRIIAALAQAGAPILAGTDQGNPYVIAGAGLHDEIELLVGAGLTRQQALRAATSAPAEYLGRPGDFGVIAPGARADLVLVGTDPLAGPLPLPPDGVMVRGRWLPGDDLRARLREIARKQAAPPSERWKDVPPLAAEGDLLGEASFEMFMNDKSVGEERLVAGVAGGRRVIVGQSVMEFPGGRVDLDYELSPESASLATRSRFGGVKLVAKLDGGKVVVTGTDARGGEVSLSEPLPAGAFLSVPTMGGMIPLGEKLASLRVGETQKVDAADLAYFPSPKVAVTEYQAERIADEGGLRVYRLSFQEDGQGLTATLTVDSRHWPQTIVFDAPVDMTVKRLR